MLIPGVRERASETPEHPRGGREGGREGGGRERGRGEGWREGERERGKEGEREVSISLLQSRS